MTMQTFDIKVAANGRLVLPVAVRAALGLEGESRVTLTLGEGGVSLRPMAQAVAQAQALYRRHVGQGASVDDFLDARRAEEAARGTRLSGES